MGNRRDEIRMNEDEINRFLNQHHYVQVATLEESGQPHLVPLWYVFRKGRICFWTYEKSHKVRNLERDGRITVLVENHTDVYEELAGVQIQGTATIVRDREEILQVGRQLLESMPQEEELGDDWRSVVEPRSQKRVVVKVNPNRITSWDHSKLNADQ